MTTIKELSKQFQLNIKENSPMGNIDIGDYKFTDINKPDPFITDLTNKNNPNIKLRINEDRDNVVLFIKKPDNSVKATNWLLRTNDKIQKTFPDGDKFFD